jgi:hypothetical protein
VACEVALATTFLTTFFTVLAGVAEVDEADGVALAVVAAVLLVELADPPLVDPIPLDIPTAWDEPSCGGVIANTAPRPLIVPPAISSARFIYFSLITCCGRPSTT